MTPNGGWILEDCPPNLYAPQFSYLQNERFDPQKLIRHSLLKGCHADKLFSHSNREVLRQIVLSKVGIH